MNMKDEEASEELLEHLKVIDEINAERPSLRSRTAKAWNKLKVKSALAHMGLMVSLSIYCVVGGIVSIQFSLLLKSKTFK